MYDVLQGRRTITASPAGRLKAIVSISFRWHVSIGDWFRPELPWDDLSLHPIKEVRRTPADSGIKSSAGWWPVPCHTTQYYISFCTPIQFAPSNTKPPLMSRWSGLGNQLNIHFTKCARSCGVQKMPDSFSFLQVMLQVTENENRCWNWSIDKIKNWLHHWFPSASASTGRIVSLPYHVL